MSVTQKGIQLLGRAIGGALGFLTEIFIATEAIPIYMTVLLVYLGYKFVLAPVFGGSDKAEKKRRSKGGDD